MTPNHKHVGMRAKPGDVLQYMRPISSALLVLVVDADDDKLTVLWLAGGPNVAVESYSRYSWTAWEIL